MNENVYSSVSITISWSIAVSVLISVHKLEIKIVQFIIILTQNKFSVLNMKHFHLFSLLDDFFPICYLLPDKIHFFLNLYSSILKLIYYRYDFFILKHLNSSFFFHRSVTYFEKESGSNSDHSHDCGYSSENNNGSCGSGSLVSSLSSSPEGSEVACSDTCCHHDTVYLSYCRLAGYGNGHQLSLQEMLEVSWITSPLS